MTDVTDLTLYKNKAYLELCLELVEEASASVKSGCYDLAESQLNDILETFDRHQLAKEKVSYRAEVYFLENKKTRL
jgi:hypothetical protein